MNDFETIIRFAISNEVADATFYTRMAEKAESKDLRNLLLEHAQQENDHQARLEEILVNHRLPTPPDRRIPEADLHIADYAVPQGDADPSLSYQDALLQAAKREQAAQKLYTDLANQHPDPAIQAIFRFMAEQKARHRNQLEREYDDQILKEN